MTIEIVVAPDQPFEIEMKVFEEDTWLVMSASNHIRAIREPLEELQATAADQATYPLGQLVIRGSGGYGIVHDFDCATPYSKVASRQVLLEVSRYIESNQLRAIALQALGAFHGAEPIEASVQRIRETSWPECLEKLWIVSPGQSKA